MTHTDSIWATPGLMDALRELAEKREYSSAAISRILSKQFKLPITRNAVIGRMHRSKLRGGFGKKRPGTNSKRTAPTFKVDPHEPAPLGDVSTGCRYLHGDALDRLFCGAETTEYGSSWCEYHSRRVWNFGPRVKFIPRRAA